MKRRWPPLALWRLAANDGAAPAPVHRDLEDPLNCTALKGLVVTSLFAALAAPATSHAQSLEEVLSQLFVFSSGEDPLFLAGTAEDPNTAIHGNHFIPAAAESNGALVSVFTGAIASNISNFPLSSTVASETFAFVGGVPTPTSNSFGPIFAERAQTLGQGRFDVGFSYAAFGFDRLRGTPLDDVQLAFVHDNTDFPGCDGIFGGDCTDVGTPVFEHDVIDLAMDLDIQAKIYAFNATFGVLNWLDIGVAVPVVSLSVSGTSRAEVMASTVDNIQHFFGGTAVDPVLTATSTSEGSTTGLGDIAGRAKIQLLDGEDLGVSILGEVRLPTGRPEDFLGTGETSFRGLFIGSATLGDFGPHTNFGYISRGGDLGSDAFQFAVGFDQRLSDWATFAIDLLGDFKIDDPLGFPEPLTFDSPITRTVSRANVRNIRDDTLDGSVGFKLQMQGGVVLWGNALIALNDGGMRSGATATFGFQYSSR